MAIFRESEASYKWILVVTLFLVSAINYADRTSITALYSLLQSDLGLTNVGLGAVGSVFLWSYAFSSPAAGFIGDRSSRGKVVLWSLAAWSLITLFTGLAATQWQLLSMRVLLGIVEAFYLPAAMALIAEYHSSETRATALGVLNLGNYLGMVGGGTLGGYLGEHYGWRTPLVLLGAAGVVIAGLCFFILPRHSSTKPMQRKDEATTTSFADTTLRLFRIPSFSVLAVAGILTAIGTWIFINWLPLYFRETFGMSMASAGFFGSSLVSIGAAASQAAGGIVSDRVARRGPHRRMLMQAVLICCATPTLLTFVFTRNETAVMIALVLYSILRSGADLNIVPLLCDITGKSQHSTAFGITNMLNTLAGGMGIFAAGFLKSGYGLSGVFAGVAGILALDTILLFAGYYLFLQKDLRPNIPEPTTVG